MTAAILAVLAVLAGFYWVWPGLDRRHEAIRYFQLSAALHLGVAFLPFLGAAESVAFWQYNRRLFLGFLRAVVFSAVLFVGIAIALGALDQLFGVDIDGETYLRIWFIIAFVVNTWIFLAAVPEDLAALGNETDYPRGLKVFAQYILTPLAFTYLIILLAYLVKIVAGGEWPSGWIGWLVASVSVTGILGYLLVHPLRSDPEEGWIRTYARWLFVGTDSGGADAAGGVLEADPALRADRAAHSRADARRLAARHRGPVRRPIEREHQDHSSHPLGAAAADAVRALEPDRVPRSRARAAASPRCCTPPDSSGPRGRRARRCAS